MAAVDRQTIYIHYGSDHYNPEQFIPVRNGDWMPKPAHGTGLWASRSEESADDAYFGWIETIKPGEIPTSDQLHEFFLPNWCYLDYEKLSEEYDAIELRNSGLFRDSLNTWDCDCILVLKNEKIRTRSNRRMGGQLCSF